MKRQKIAPELKEQIINRIKNDGVTVAQVAQDHGIGVRLDCQESRRWSNNFRESQT
jgi:transposase-like protein